MQNLKDIRTTYKLKELDENFIHEDPFVQFFDWLEAAIAASVPEPTAMALSTVSNTGRPASRIVLLKALSDKGLDFFTNYESRKGQHIRENKNVCLLFFWKELERQVRIEGTVVKLEASESDAYFFSRPADSQIGAWASPQSHIIPNRKTLMDWYEEFESIFKNGEQKRPPQWGGYRVIPNLFEFWQGRESRLHDRIEYIFTDGLWKHHRLAP